MIQAALAFSKDETIQKFKTMLENSGVDVALVSHSRAELVRNIGVYDDILIIMGCRLPDGMADDVYDDLGGEYKMLVIVKPGHEDLITRDEIVVLPLPINRQGLLSAVEMIVTPVSARRKGKRSLEEEKIIKQAKLYLIDKYRMTESQAHRFIQKRSMDTGARFVDTARLILDI